MSRLLMILPQVLEDGGAEARQRKNPETMKPLEVLASGDIKPSRRLDIQRICPSQGKNKPWC
jgi:hypothetical protein